MSTPTTKLEPAATGTVIPLFRDGQAPSLNDAYRLERAIERVRALLNDPVALRRRAAALLNGTATELLGFD